MKRHRANIAIFIGVEDKAGGTGDLFIAYLKRRFQTDGVRVTHKACLGGSYGDMTRRAKNAAANDDFDKRILVWDQDRMKQGIDTPQNEAGYDLVLCEPSIEGEILSLLSPNGARPATTKDCKKELGDFNHIEQMERRLKTIPNERFLKNKRLYGIIAAIRGTV